MGAAACAAIDELDEFRLREGAAIENRNRARARPLSVTSSAAWKRSAPAPFRSFSSACAIASPNYSPAHSSIPARHAQEAALLAERSDISEELVRLPHPRRSDRCAPRRPMAKPASSSTFLLQEMNRENQHADSFQNRRPRRNRPDPYRSRPRRQSRNRPHPRAVSLF